MILVVVLVRFNFVVLCVIFSMNSVCSLTHSNWNDSFVCVWCDVGATAEAFRYIAANSQALVLPDASLTLFHIPLSIELHFGRILFIAALFSCIFSKIFNYFFLLNNFSVVRWALPYQTKMNIAPPNAIASPQQPQSQQSQGSTSSTGSLPTAQSKTESLDNIAKVKSLAGPLRDSLAVSTFGRIENWLLAGKKSRQKTLHSFVTWFDSFRWH